ncbi:hypothetical protein PISMIDRAFT_618461 [Pisolithus microcarpus 441]|uniref:Uncharacterized protein n=1 Tax=Pisolithus microcarpus 441 TaxID=765257 RepID=A0A0C9ZB75_9AGAM|nr:hypothetical protein PISMIDRAFT_618461 [Pisolithus microcarpus 441]
MGLLGFMNSECPDIIARIRMRKVGLYHLSTCGEQRWWWWDLQGYSEVVDHAAAISAAVNADSLASSNDPSLHPPHLVALRPFPPL